MGIELCRLTVAEAARAIADRSISSEELVSACLAQIDRLEPNLRAFAHLDADRALDQARAADRVPPRSPLHGIPLAIKDVFDTVDLPTAYNSPIYAGHRPSQDAACVARLRSSGAVILGKTVTAEFAHVHPGKTANPHDVRYSPGGSSSGSAAAVAAYMAPLALGTQTGGSTIRPGSFCGVFAFKPSFGRIALEGVKALAPSLDTAGFFARSVDDLMIIDRVLADAPTAARRDSRLRLGICRALRDRAEPAARALLDDVANRLEGWAEVIELDLPSEFDALPAASLLLINVEMAQSLAHEYAAHRNALSETARDAIAAGLAAKSTEVERAYTLQSDCSARLDGLLEQLDAITTLSAPGEAPLGRGSGDSIFNRTWTMLHVPCLNLPVGRGPNGMPIGVQLVGRKHRDFELLQNGKLVWEHLYNDLPLVHDRV